MDRRDFLKASAAATLTLAADTTWAQNARTEIHWLGQATAKITTPSGKVIVIDPWLVNNPKTPADYKNLDKLGKVDVILVTHAHGDHVGTLGRSDGTSDTADLAKRTGAKVFGPAGLIQTMIDLGWVTGEQSEEHTSELQSLAYLVCRLLLEKKKKKKKIKELTE